MKFLAIKSWFVDLTDKLGQTTYIEKGPTFCRFSLRSAVGVVPDAYRTLSRLAMDASPAFYVRNKRVYCYEGTRRVTRYMIIQSENVRLTPHGK